MRNYGMDGSLDRDVNPMPYGLITVLASAGALETAYLTVSKLLSAPVSCPTSGSCDTVLSSGYASVFGVPLPLLGCLAYGAVAFIAGRQSMQEATRSHQSLADGDRARYAVLAGSTALATTSGYLLYLLATVFRGETCVWCLTSAALSLTTFASAMRGFTMRRELADTAGPGSGLVASIILGLALAWSNVEAPEAQAGNFELQYMEPRVSEVSTPRSVELAKRLKAAGAKMYGAFWCSHCFEQKQSFGKEAMAELPYVECYPDGYYKDVKLAKECVDANLTGFPAWIINGKRLDGEQTFEKLEAELAQAQTVVQ
ncbi:VKOR-domain-containing protein [Coccomyxa subellipsoidea C-169]|uniref:VKOR-domain-containing protein n=1 Tax=Coccomyxa subellipsoidea (strain C-169) TaxID=574566 RepID=I0Z3E9_COCSC|nr:VKOR-domain-containing protein [Coccomyxa subellipsoidea C-169]EIE25168.1 VKOR-domain-containing protein [Coccomyxa subellipsoidea C-169]|eukprot:XP_005649712.1 VKOR-domain-containing protein [Coccomyxa subellipsoidea C-169]